MIILAGRMCLEAGAYLVNSNSCSQCSNRNLVTRTVDNTDNESRDSWDEDEEVEVVEDIKYNHVCGSCDHIIALHKVRKVITMKVFWSIVLILQYKFWLEEGRQEYKMECLLCGIGEDSASVMPHDPRKASSLEA